MNYSSLRFTLRTRAFTQSNALCNQKGKKENSTLFSSIKRKHIFCHHFSKHVENGPAYEVSSSILYPWQSNSVWLITLITCLLVWQRNSMLLPTSVLGSSNAEIQDGGSTVCPPSWKPWKPHVITLVACVQHRQGPCLFE